MINSWKNKQGRIGASVSIHWILLLELCCIVFALDLLTRWLLIMNIHLLQ